MRYNNGFQLIALIAACNEVCSLSISRTKNLSRFSPCVSYCRYEGECQTPQLSATKRFANGGQPSGTMVQLVILIPAYNEAERIQSTLRNYQDFLMDFSPEIIKPKIVVVDDGSVDVTIQVVEEFPSKIPIECVKMEENKGKGAALSRGVQYVSDTISRDSLCADNVWILTQDADGSGDLIYLDGMIQSLGKLLCCNAAQPSDGTVGQGLVIGNRIYNFFSTRGVTRWGFQTCVRILTSNELRVNDTQCGYKLMTLKTAESLYKKLNLNGWSHDVEVLYRASLLNIPVDEMLIEWKDMAGSKVTESGVVGVSLQMLWDVIRLRWNYSVLKSWTLEA